MQRRSALVAACAAALASGGLLPRQAAADDRRYLDNALPFGEPRDRRVDVTDMNLEVRVEPAARRVTGKVAWTACARSADKDLALTLDAVDVDVHDVRWQQAPGGPQPLAAPGPGAPLRFVLPGEGEGRCATLSLAFAASPRKGFHFIAPDRDEPGRAAHVWTQGEPRQARHWLPSPDDPDERFRWKLAVDAPAPWRVLSNGEPRGVDRASGRVVARFEMTEPHPVYLISIVAGPFEEVVHRHGRVHLADYALPPDLARAKAHGSELPAMLDLFEALTGTPYPHGRYGEVWVHDFTAGGMENVTLTTLAHRALGDAASDQDRRPDGLLAHELAHQWFGDLVTCRHWGDIWLNEGFATYYQKLWTLQRYGRDRFAEELSDARSAALGTDAAKPRAVVQDRFEHPGELFDSHSYARGALVLHMLRETLGHQPFDRGIAAYLRAHRFGSVETADLRRALEAASGRSLRGFFRRWLEQPGLPTLEVSANWSSQQGLVIEVEQRQTIDAARPAFELDLEIDVAPSAAAPAQRHVLQLRGKRGALTIATPPAGPGQPPGPPALVAVDPEGKLLAAIRLQLEAELVLGGLHPSRHPQTRLQAVDALRGHIDRPAVRDALLRTLATDSARHVRAAAARALGAGQRADVRAGLQQALQRDGDALVRAAAAAGLGALYDEASVAMLQRAAQAETSPAVVREAHRALFAIDRRAARPVVLGALQRSSFYETIRGDALQQLAAFGDARDLETIWAASRPGHAKALRAAAAVALARLAVRVDAAREAVRDHLAGLLHEDESRLRGAVVVALGAISDPQSREALLAAAAREPHEHLQVLMRETAKDLGKALPAEERLRKLEEAVERLERQRHERGHGAPPASPSQPPPAPPAQAPPAPPAQGGRPPASPAPPPPAGRSAG